jgi:hypothetical protein
MSGTSLAGCGGESTSTISTPGDTTDGGDAAAGSDTPDHAASGPSDAVADSAFPGADTVLPSCCPHPGNYFIEVIVGGDASGEIYKFGSPGSGNTAAGITCAPTAPWSYLDASGNWGIYACASSDSMHRCINLDNGDPGGGRYIDAQGVVSSLRHPAIMPSGDPPSGEYTASMISPSGSEIMLHGRFSVCLAFMQSL